MEISNKSHHGKHPKPMVFKTSIFTPEDTMPPTEAQTSDTGSTTPTSATTQGPSLDALLATLKSNSSDLASQRAASDAAQASLQAAQAQADLAKAAEQTAHDALDATIDTFTAALAALK